MTARVAAVPAPSVLSKAVVRAADGLGLTRRELAAVLGTSEATVSRLARGRGLEPDSKEGEIALLLLRLWRSLQALVGDDDDRSRAWMEADNRALGGRPADLVQGVEGLVRALAYLDALRGQP